MMPGMKEYTVHPLYTGILTKLGRAKVKMMEMSFAGVVMNTLFLVILRDFPHSDARSHVFAFILHVGISVRVRVAAPVVNVRIQSKHISSAVICRMSRAIFLPR
jgi:hypothetical protein